MLFRELSIYSDVSFFFVFIQHFNHYFVDLLQFYYRCVTNLYYVLIYYILDNLVWLYFPLTPIEKSNRPIVYHVVRLPMRFKQGELKVSRQMNFEFLFLPCNCLLHHVEDYAINFGLRILVELIKCVG
jgi:hypothetical protein